MDKEGKTPLIVACMDSGLINVAKTLIELGANINAYRPGKFLNDLYCFLQSMRFWMVIQIVW